MTQNPQDQPTDGGQQPYSGPPPPPPPPPPGQDAYGQQGPGYGQTQAAYGQAPVSPSDARMWSIFAHIGGIFFSFVPALVIYLVYKDRDAFIRRHAAQALNFQIILVVVYFVSSLLIIVLIGIFMLFAAGIACLVLSILAAIAANKGEEYTYPLTPQMVS